MRSMVRVAAATLGLLIGLLSVVTANAASIRVTPSSVPVGGRVTLSGDVLGPNGQPACQVPGTVTLISGAFAGQGSFQSQDVETTAGTDGKYSVQAQVLSSVTPGTYTVTGRCGGGNLGVQATLVVLPAPPVTGSGPQQQDWTAGLAGSSSVAAVLAVLALTVLAVGVVARRRSSPKRGEDQS